MSTENNFRLFLWDLVGNPLTCLLTIAVLFMIVSNTRLWPMLLALFKKSKAV